MTSPGQREQLKQFLRARRAALTPAEVGLPPGSRRLVEGLRREEVAMLAGIGVTWYTFLEQGRDIGVSAAAIRQIAGALRLGPADEAYLAELAGVDIAAPKIIDGNDAPLLFAALETYVAPAVVYDPLFNVMGCNRIAERHYRFADDVGPYQRNELWQMFMNPARERLHEDYAECAAHVARLFRLMAASHIADPAYVELVDTLRKASPLFEQVWTSGQAETPMPRAMRLTPPDHPAISVWSLRLTAPSQGGGILSVLVADDALASSYFAGLSARCLAEADLRRKDAFDPVP